MSELASRQGSPAQPRRAKFQLRILPAILVVYACMMPREFTFQLAGIDFAPFRVALILMLPFAVILAGQQRMKPSFIDGLIVFSMIWVFIALWVTVSVNVALLDGLAEGLNLALAYFIGRVAIKTSKDLQRFFIAVLPGLLFCSAILAVESFSHQNLLRPFIANLLNYDAGVYTYLERLGLMRAQGPFPHPILGGVFMASFLPFAWYMTDKVSTRILALLAVAGFFFSVSSTGFLGIIVAAGLIITCFAHRVTKLPVFQAVIAATIFMMVFIELFSGGGLFSFIIRRLTFSAATGQYRMAIWEWAGADALNHPIFGIGLRTYIRPGWMVKASVDAHWLLITLRYGFPYGTAVLITMLGSAALSLRGAWSPYPLDQRAAYAIGFSLIAIAFTGLSVYLWEGMGIWMTVLTGMGVTFGQQMALAVRSSPARSIARPTARLAPRPA